MLFVVDFRLLDMDADVAQPAEHVLGKDGVTSSNLVISSILTLNL